MIRDRLKWSGLLLCLILGVCLSIIAFVHLGDPPASEQELQDMRLVYAKEIAKGKRMKHSAEPAR